MKITIDCECGNSVVMQARKGKYIQTRDFLYSKQFGYGKSVYVNGKLKEVNIQCDKCHAWISLGTD